MAENPRIEELRRRVQKDPASIAFAQLAEEYRRAGHYEDAIDICRAGLQTHPSYLSARVTLGRALIEMNDLENAETELRFVLQHAAENLAAIRAMAEIHQRRGELSAALGFYKSALELARHDPDLEQTVDEIARTIAKTPAPAPVAPPEAAPALTPEQRNAEFLANTFDLLDLDDLDLGLPSAETVAAEPLIAAPVMSQPIVSEPMPAEPVITAAIPEPESEPQPEQPFQAAPVDDLILLEDSIFQDVPEVDPGAALTEAPPPFDEYSGRPEPSRGTQASGEERGEGPPRREDEVAPGAAWGAGAPQASGEERGEGPPRPEEEAAPGAAWGVGAPQASGEERGEGPPRPEDEDDFAPMDVGVIVHPALPGLERFLEAIHTYRHRRAV